MPTTHERHSALEESELDPHHQTKRRGMVWAKVSEREKLRLGDLTLSDSRVGRSHISCLNTNSALARRSGCQKKRCAVCCLLYTLDVWLCI